MSYCRGRHESRSLRAILLILFLKFIQVKITPAMNALSVMCPISFPAIQVTILAPMTPSRWAASVVAYSIGGSCCRLYYLFKPQDLYLETSKNECILSVAFDSSGPIGIFQRLSRS
jgi:hypothetical protein